MAAKRALDVVLSGFGLVASAPLWAVCAVAIKLEDGGPVFYTQERVGSSGGCFRVLKFRSMTPDAEAGIGAVQARPDDPRITRCGRVMRAMALDELPQLVNILRGEMSFVGPRALRPHEVERHGGAGAVPLDQVPGFRERCSVRPGLTGIAQVRARRDLPRRQKFRYDRFYIRKRSLRLDLRLLLLSFWISCRGAWEASEEKS